MRAPLLLLALALVAPLRDAPAAAATNEDLVEVSYVRVVLKRGSTSAEWPGYDVQHDEVTILEFSQGSVKHALELKIARPEGGDYQVEYAYARGGREIVGKTKATVAPRTPLKIKKGDAELLVTLDPTGGSDHSRKDKIDGPHGDNPLD